MRPAETTAALGSVGAALAYVFGVRDPQTLAAIATGVGLLPGAVTLLVTYGGIRGCALRLWRGATSGKPRP